MSLYAGPFVVIAVWLMAALAADAFLSTADELIAGAGIALTAPPPDPKRDLNLVHVCFQMSDVVRGQRIAVLAFLLGGIPAASVGWALRLLDRRRQPCWPAGWGQIFQAGFVFQVSCLLVTALFAAVFGAPAVLLAPSSFAILIPVTLLVVIAGNIWGLRSWRALQAAMREPLPRVTPEWIWIRSPGRHPPL